jgi:lichenan operon transcriptional antiterminator
LFEQIKTRFSKDLQIFDIINHINNISDFENVDIIISIINLTLSCPSHVIVISPFFTEEDEQSIASAIHSVQQLKRKHFMKEAISYLFRKDLFYVKKDFADSSEAIEYLCNDMLEKGLVDKSYKSEIYLHEEIAPTSYGNFAIPHPLTSDASSSFIALVIQKNGIKWGSNLVNFVFMLSVTPEEHHLIRIIFDYISEIIFDKQITDKLLSCENYDDFIEAFLSHL